MFLQQINLSYIDKIINFEIIFSHIFNLKYKFYEKSTIT
ncbi:MAG: hypothetical protein ACJA1N_001490 [Saprospiraceae bacterium]|jgi:hypothetical protein